MEHQEHTHHDMPQVRIYPPVVVAATIALGLLMQFLFPLQSLDAPFLKGIGFMLTLGALAILWWSDVTFKKVGTDADPTRPSTDLIIHGPHEYSRNPVYLSFLLLAFGIGLWVGALWLIILNVVQYFALERMIIVHEEAYLSRKFGERYKRYCEKVRRWL